MSDTDSVSKETQAIIAMQERFRDLSALLTDEVIQNRITLEVVLDLQRAILAKLGLEVLEIDEMCRISRLRAQTSHEKYLLTLLKPPPAPK